MDDEPSAERSQSERPEAGKKSSKSERAAFATPNETSEAASASEQRGIYERLTRFGEIFAEMTLGVNEATPRDVDPDDWADVFQEISIEIWFDFLARPDYVAGAPRLWARRSAKLHRMEDKRNAGRRAKRHEVFMQERIENNRDLMEIEKAIEDQERDRDLGRAFRLLTPSEQYALIDRYVRNRPRSETAKDLEVSVRKLKRMLEKSLAKLAFLLSDWNPRKSR